MEWGIFEICWLVWTIGFLVTIIPVSIELNIGINRTIFVSVGWPIALIISFCKGINEFLKLGLKNGK